MSKFWKWVKAESGQELYIDGIIASESWFEDEISPKMFREELAEHPGDVTVRINSPGGDVHAGVAIYNNLVEHEGNISVKVDGLAASAASFIAMAGDNITMLPGSMMMVHEPWTLAAGNSDDISEAVEMLKKTTESMIPIYANRTGLSEERIRELLKAETWMSAEDAVELGFADEAVPAKERASALKAAMGSAADIQEAIMQPVMSLKGAKMQDDTNTTEEHVEDTTEQSEATTQEENQTEQTEQVKTEETQEETQVEETEKVEAKQTKNKKEETMDKTVEQEIAQESVQAKAEVPEQPKQEAKMDKYDFAAQQFAAWVNKDHKTLADLNQKALDSYREAPKAETYHNTTVTADGGAIVPSAELLEDVYSTLGEFSTVAQDLRVVTLTEGNALDVATLVTDVVVNEVSSEGGDKDVTKMAFGDEEITLREFAGISIITKKLVRQAAVNIYSLLRESFARAIANKRAELALDDSTSGIVNNGGVVTLTASGTTVDSYTWTDVKKMPYQVPVAAVPGAKYYISRELLERLDTIQDSDGRDLEVVELSGDQLSGRFKNGYSFAVEERLGQGDVPHAVFGSMSRYGILLRQAMVESETFDQGTVTDGEETEHNLIQQNKLAHRVAFYENVGYPVPGAFVVLESQDS